MIPISPIFLLHSCKKSRPFETYIKIKNSDNFILYAKHDDILTDKHRDMLFNNNIDNLYIEPYDIELYHKYIEDNYGNILINNDIDINDRLTLFYKHNNKLINNIFETDFCNLNKKLTSYLYNIIDSNYTFITNEHINFKTIASFIDHNYKTYSHSIHVMIYSLIVSNKLGITDLNLIRSIGIGSFLHDLGKLKISNSILNKPDKLTSSEFDIIKKHPIYGLELSQSLGISQESINIILMHHEKLDGSGYPSNTINIPDYVKIVTISDMYDALSSIRPYCKAYTPFESLCIISKDVEKNKIDKTIFKEFVKLLGNDIN